MNHLFNLMVEASSKVKFPDLREMGDYFVITMEKKPDVRQELFDRFQNLLEGYIQKARKKGYTVKSGRDVDGEHPLSVIFIKERKKLPNAKTGDSDDS